MKCRSSQTWDCSSSLPVKFQAPFFCSPSDPPLASQLQKDSTKTPWGESSSKHQRDITHPDFSLAQMQFLVILAVSLGINFHDIQSQLQAITVQGVSSLMRLFYTDAIRFFSLSSIKREKSKMFKWLLLNGSYFQITSSAFTDSSACRLSALWCVEGTSSQKHNPPLLCLLANQATALRKKMLITFQNFTSQGNMDLDAAQLPTGNVLASKGFVFLL